MPVPNPGSKVDSDNQNVEFLRIFGRPGTTFFRQFVWCSGPIKDKEPAKAQLRFGSLDASLKLLGPFEGGLEGAATEDVLLKASGGVVGRL
jgi:hypothetical protein